MFEEKLKQRLDNLPLEEITPQILNNLLLETHFELAEALTAQIFSRIGNDADMATAKAVTDQVLTEMGYEPINEELSGDPKFAIAKYISLVTTPKTNLTENINLTSSVLAEYLSKEEIIDGEIARKIKTAFYKEVEHDAEDYDKLFSEGEFEPVYYEEADAAVNIKNLNTFIPALLSRLKLGLDNNEDLNTIVSDWLFGPNGQIDTSSEEFKLFKQNIMPDVEAKAVEMIVQKLSTLPSAKLYEVVRNKTQKSNPFFDKLR
jgi:hypothetical protein